MGWSIQDLGAAGEFLSALAVVVTLAFIARQLYLSNVAAQSAAIQSFFDATASINRDRRLLTTGIVRKGLSDWDALSLDERVELDSYFSDFASKIHMGFRLYERGVLDKQTYESWEDALVVYLREPGIGKWWQAAKEVWPDDLRARLDVKVQAPEPAISELIPWYRASVK